MAVKRTEEELETLRAHLDASIPQVPGRDKIIDQIMGQNQFLTPEEEAVKSLGDEAKNTRTRNEQVVDEFLGEAIPALKDSVGLASAYDLNTQGRLRDLNENFVDVPLHDYGGDISSQAASASADSSSIAAQKEALAKYKELSDPSVTAQEKFLMELARRKQEQSLRADREATLRNLQARGVAGSGAEIGSMLGSQQNTGNTRMLQDLGTQAGAVDRAMQALGGYSDLSSQMRAQSFGETFQRGTAADAIAEFNALQKEQYNQFRDKTLMEQQRDTWGRGLDLAGVEADMTNRHYGRQRDLYGAKERGAAMKTDQYSGDSSAVNDAAATRLGHMVGMRKDATAAQAANDDDNWFADAIKKRIAGI